MDFKDKVVIVTGASRGIGAAIAIAFAKQKANVVLVGRAKEKLQKVADLCKNDKNATLVIPADITRDEDAKSIIDKTIERFGKLDILINNAGIFAIFDIESENAVDIFDQIYKTNMRSIIVLCKAAVKYLAVTKGNIINISSVASMKATSPNVWAYGGLKACLDYVTRGLAIDLADKGIRVNTVNPGPVKTDIFDSMLANESPVELSWDTLASMTILKRVSDPEEIAETVLFLASDKAKSVTGSSYLIDCGTFLK